MPWPHGFHSHVSFSLLFFLHHRDNSLGSWFHHAPNFWTEPATSCSTEFFTKKNGEDGIEGKQLLCCSLKTKKFECNMSQLNYSILPRAQWILVRLLAFPYRKEGRLILLPTQKENMKRHTHTGLLHSFFYLPTEPFHLLDIQRGQTVGTQGGTQQSQISPLEKTPNTYLFTHLISLHEHQFTYQEHQRTNSGEVTGMIAVKFLWTKNCHLTPLKVFITRSLDWIITQG